MTKIQTFKQELARVFDDDLHTKQWHNYVDYAIIGLIILSTVEVFLSTYDGIVEKYGLWLKVVDYFTTAFFTIEVSLRIWCADLIDDKYKGFFGRVRYCFSFYGLIDILSTYPFYLHFFMPMPYVALKALRIARLLRVFRYMKAFNVLSRAMRAKKDEMWVSVQFLTIITLILSFILFFVEHEAQPEVYNNGWTSVLWAFAQYIGDPGNFADTPPITITGRVIACIIGVLGIAIFAVPAGLIGSAFSEVMEKDERKEKSEGWTERLHLAFERKRDRITQFFATPKFVSIADIQARLGLKEDEIFDAVANSDEFRLINLAATRTIEEQAEDKLAVEHFPLNRPYGCCINRHSKITIMNAVASADAITGWAAFYLAKMGGFNYISREIGAPRPFKSFYLNDGEDTVPYLKEYMDDLRELAPDEDSWVITLMAASGAQEPIYPTQIHFTCGVKKGDETYSDPNITIHDIPLYDKMWHAVADALKKQFDLDTDNQRYYDNSSPRVYARKWPYKINACGLRIAWSVMCWDTRSIQVLQTIAEQINQQINHTGNPEVQDLKNSGIGYSDYAD